MPAAWFEFRQAMSQIMLDSLGTTRACRHVDPLTSDVARPEDRPQVTEVSGFRFEGLVGLNQLSKGSSEVLVQRYSVHPLSVSIRIRDARAPTIHSKPQVDEALEMATFGSDSTARPARDYLSSVLVQPLEQSAVQTSRLRRTS